MTWTPHETDAHSPKELKISLALRAGEGKPWGQPAPGWQTRSSASPRVWSGDRGGDVPGPSVLTSMRAELLPFCHLKTPAVAPPARSINGETEALGGNLSCRDQASLGGMKPPISCLRPSALLLLPQSVGGGSLARPSLARPGAWLCSSAHGPQHRPPGNEDPETTAERDRDGDTRDKELERETDAAWGPMVHHQGQRGQHRPF